MAKLINIGFGNVVNSPENRSCGEPGCRSVKRMVQSVKVPIPLWMPLGKKDQVCDRYLRPHSDIICDPADTIAADLQKIIENRERAMSRGVFGSFRIFRSRKRHHYEKPDGEVRQLRIVCICHHQKPQTRGRRRKRILFPHKRRI